MDPISGLLNIGGKLIEKLIPDPAQKAQAQLELLKLQQSGELEEMRVGMSAIIAEAKSLDPFTSRARPSFLYVFYAVVVVLVLIAPIIGVFFPDEMIKFYENVALGFNAIPEPMWWTFTTGYLGYTAARQYGKLKGTDK